LVGRKWWGAGVIVCLERGADLHTAQLMSLPLTVSCLSEIQIGFAFLVPAHLGRPGQRAVKWVCMCVYIIYLTSYRPGGGETICSRRWQFDSQRIYVRPRTGLQSAHFWWPALAELQAASVPVA